MAHNDHKSAITANNYNYDPSDYDWYNNDTSCYNELDDEGNSEDGEEELVVFDYCNNTTRTAIMTASPTNTTSAAAATATSTTTEETIRILDEHEGLALQMPHLHSFQQVPLLSSMTFAFAFTPGACLFCEQSISISSSSLLFANSEQSSSIVKCVACGMYAHRRCCSTSNQDCNNNKKCKVNSERLLERKKKQKYANAYHLKSAPAVADTSKNNNDNSREDDGPSSSRRIEDNNEEQQASTAAAIASHQGAAATDCGSSTDDDGPPPARVGIVVEDEEQQAASGSDEPPPHEQGSTAGASSGSTSSNDIAVISPTRMPKEVAEALDVALSSSSDSDETSNHKKEQSEEDDEEPSSSEHRRHSSGGSSNSSKKAEAALLAMQETAHQLWDNLPTFHNSKEEEENDDSGSESGSDSGRSSSSILEKISDSKSSASSLLGSMTRNIPLTQIMDHIPRLSPPPTSVVAFIPHIHNNSNDTQEAKEDAETESSNNNAKDGEEKQSKKEGIVDEEEEEPTDRKTTSPTAAKKRHKNKGPFHFANHSFHSVGRVLQENVLASFQQHVLLQQQQQQKKSPPSPPRRTVSAYPGTRGGSSSIPDDDNSKTKKLSALSEAASQEIREQEGGNDMSTGSENPMVKFAETVKSKVNVATVAGGIAGGVAGFALAGPAGAYAGYAAGFLAEGAASIGVVAAGIATGGLTGQQIEHQRQEREKKKIRRISLLGEEGNRTLLLVRPGIRIDPVWDQIYYDARNSASLQLFRFQNNNNRDADIIRTEEDEINTADKILLLVSRTLNDKNSVPGHVYRCLVEAFKERCQFRQNLCDTNTSVAGLSPRARRDDAHAVINFVTATLLEDRPELGDQFTELTATAVEALVFGHLYDSVYEEIVQETCERDIDLWRKISKFDQEHPDIKESMQDLVSDEAVRCLKMLPLAKSAADKLFYCVKFLDLVSEHFSNTTANDGGENNTTTNKLICADSLLKMVCQHVILGENRGSCHAQVAFLEEFSLDEQLLRGRDGYALVTLQASLHFLYKVSDFQREIFEANEDDYSESSDSSSYEDLT